MTREEAIAEIKEYLKAAEIESQEIAFRACLNVVEQIEPKTVWIPVTEKIPETNDDVLVYDGVDIFVAYYQTKDMWQGWKSTDNAFDRVTPIIAWMPLPKPYEENDRKR